MIWRIWLEKGTPLNEMKNEWTYVDLLKANALLDMMEDHRAVLEGVQEEQRQIEKNRRSK